MAKEINHWCVVCGKGYHACDSCNTTKTFTPWRVLTDTIDHFKIFTTLKDYNNGLINKEEAKELLSNVDLSEKDSFRDGSKKLLNEIFKEDIVEVKPTKRKNSKVESNKSVSDNENVDTNVGTETVSIVIDATEENL
jgi:hypothetical protein